MNKVISTALLLFFFIPPVLSASNDSTSVKHGEKDSWYLQVYGGVNHSMNENLDDRLYHTWGVSGQSVGGGAFIGIGQEWSPVWGWRCTMGYNSNQGRATFYNKEPKIYTFHDVELLADVTFDLLDAVSPKRKHKGFNLKLFAGAGGLQTFGFPDEPLSYSDEYSRSPRLNWGCRIGLAARVRLSEAVSIGTEFSQYFIDDHFSGVARNFPLDGRQNLSVGLAWEFKRKNNRNKKPIPEDDSQRPVQTPDIPVVTEEIPAEIESTEAEPTVNIIVVYKEPAYGGMKKRVLDGRAFLDFPVNQTIIYEDYRNNSSELRKIIESIDVIKRDTSVSITSIGIHGYASPEGPYANNIRLADGRSEALKKYLIGMYDFKSDIITVSYTPEDWEGLQHYVENDYPGDDREAVLAAVTNTSLPEDLRERELKKVLGTEAYRDILTNVYPGLRHSDYTVSYVIRDYTVEEAMLMIKEHPDHLSLRELYQVAISYPKESPEYKETLILAASLYPDDETANLNAANVSLESNDPTAAGYYLDRAGDSPQAIHARGVLAVMNGDYASAGKWLQQSYDAGIRESADIYPGLVK